MHLTTQAASKVYRAEAGCARQLVSLRVAPGAFAEYVPDALIPHAGARLASEVVADVEPGGAAIVTETVAPGRVARGEAFEYERLALVTRLACAGERRAVDTLLLEPGRLDPRRAGMLGERGYFASLFAVAPDRDSEALAARSRRRSPRCRAPLSAPARSRAARACSRASWRRPEAPTVRAWTPPGLRPARR